MLLDGVLWGGYPRTAAAHFHGAITRKAGSCDSLQVEKPHDGLTVLSTGEGDLSLFVRGF